MPGENFSRNKFYLVPKVAKFGQIFLDKIWTEKSDKKIQNFASMWPVLKVLMLYFDISNKNIFLYWFWKVPGRNFKNILHSNTISPKLCKVKKGSIDSFSCDQNAELRNDCHNEWYIPISPDKIPLKFILALKIMPIFFFLLAISTKIWSIATALYLFSKLKPIGQIYFASGKSIE